MYTPPADRLIRYRLTTADVTAVQEQRAAHPDLWRGSAVEAGQAFPAAVVTATDTSYSLRVFLDGTDTLWVQACHEGDTSGTWYWPKSGTGDVPGQKPAPTSPTKDPVEGGK